MNVLMHNLRHLSDFIFPPSDSLRLVRTTTPHDVLALYHPHHHHAVTTLTEYQEPRIKAIITAAKFEHNEQALKLLTPLLIQYLREKQFDLKTTIFVPIPLHPKRQRERGYNQITSLLTYLKQDNGDVTIVSALSRKRHTKAQSHLRKQERKTNIKDAFCLNQFTHPRDGVTDIILLDDVITTGHTLGSAYDALQRHVAPHVKIHPVAVARSY